MPYNGSDPGCRQADGSMLYVEQEVAKVLRPIGWNINPRVFLTFLGEFRAAQIDKDTSAIDQPVEGGRR
jgi:hypothetical protein